MAMSVTTRLKAARLADRALVQEEGSWRRLACESCGVHLFGSLAAARAAVDRRACPLCGGAVYMA